MYFFFKRVDMQKVPIFLPDKLIQADALNCCLRRQLTSSWNRAMDCESQTADTISTTLR